MASSLYPNVSVIMSVFMQWNMRGLQANREELSLLLSQYHPTASAYKKLCCIVIKQLPSKTIHTMAYLLWKIIAHFMVVQAIAVRATCHKTITICSIYLSPSIACNITELPPSFLLLGDFSHTVSNGASPNAALEERWWRTFSSNLTCLSLIVAHLLTATLLQHLFQLSISA